MILLQKTHILEHFFNDINNIQSLLFLLKSRSHLVTQCDGFLFLYFYKFLKLSNSRHDSKFYFQSITTNLNGLHIIKGDTMF